MFYILTVPDEQEPVVLRAFTEETVRHLTNLSKRQLQYWDERRFIRPAVAAGRGRGRRRLYDFRDLVSLQVAAQLRLQGISLQLIRKVADHLRGLDFKAPLSEVWFWVWEGRLYFQESDTVRAGRRPEQVVMGYDVPVPAIVDSLNRQIREWDERHPGLIEQRRGVLGSKPVFAGTRIPVASIRRLLRSGAASEEILGQFPDLTEADVAVAAKEAPRIARRAS